MYYMHERLGVTSHASVVHSRTHLDSPINETGSGSSLGLGRPARTGDAESRRRGNALP